MVLLLVVALLVVSALAELREFTLAEKTALASCMFSAKLSKSLYKQSFESDGFLSYYERQRHVYSQCQIIAQLVWDNDKINEISEDVIKKFLKQVKPKVQEARTSVLFSERTGDEHSFLIGRVSDPLLLSGQFSLRSTAVHSLRLYLASLEDDARHLSKDPSTDLLYKSFGTMIDGVLEQIMIRTMSMKVYKMPKEGRKMNQLMDSSKVHTSAHSYIASCRNYQLIFDQIHEIIQGIPSESRALSERIQILSDQIGMNRNVRVRGGPWLCSSAVECSEETAQLVDEKNRLQIQRDSLLGIMANYNYPQSEFKRFWSLKCANFYTERRESSLILVDIHHKNSPDIPAESDKFPFFLEWSSSPNPEDTIVSDILVHSLSRTTLHLADFPITQQTKWKMVQRVDDDRVVFEGLHDQNMNTKDDPHHYYPGDERNVLASRDTYLYKEMTQFKDSMMIIQAVKSVEESAYPSPDPTLGCLWVRVSPHTFLPQSRSLWICISTPYPLPKCLLSHEDDPPRSTLFSRLFSRRTLSATST